MIENIIFYIIIASAVLFVAQHFYKKFTKPQGCSCCSSCSNKDNGCNKIFENKSQIATISSSNNHHHDFLLGDKKIKSNERKTLIVVLLTFTMMIIEVSFGYITGSMALLADGWHMGSHVGALGISLIAYKLARSSKLSEKLSFGTGKFIPLGGYTSALMLGLVALVMAVESFMRFMNPVEINFSTAIFVAIIGLIVNIISAFILSDPYDHSDHTKKHIHDHNHNSAFIHVIADALTSLFAIVALLLGKYFGWDWADPMMGIVGSLVILKWAVGLCKATIWELLDGDSKHISKHKIKQLFSDIESAQIIDLHVWRIAPKAHACEMIIYNKKPLGSAFYRNRILEKLPIEHLIIEERT